MRKVIKGIAASKGIVIAKAYKLEELNLEVNDIISGTIEEEVSLVSKVFNDTINQLDDIYKTALVKLGEEEASVFEAHKAHKPKGLDSAKTRRNFVYNVLLA